MTKLQDYNQWLIWKFETKDGKKTKVPYSINDQKCDPTNPNNWYSFSDAIDIANELNASGIGFCLSKEDDLVCIDIDNPATEEDRKLSKEIIKYIDSYIETSPSGKGAHVWGLYKNPKFKGCRTRSFEIYSHSRFLTWTGKAIKDIELKDITLEIDKLLVNVFKKNIVDKEVQAIPHISKEEKDSDELVLHYARSAKNGELFDNLYYGRFDIYFKSQSEADLALVNIIAHYTSNDEQIERIFLSSMLGKREKAQRSDYIVSLIDKAHDMDMPYLDFSKLSNIAKESAQIVKRVDRGGIIHTFPSGLMGQIAHYILNSAPRPFNEAALAGAIALMSALAGRAYNISGTGLNTYIVLLAKTGRGKEAAASGINAILDAASRTQPRINFRIGASKIASSQALVRMISESPCQTCCFGEIGKLFSNLSTSTNEHLTQLQSLFLQLYSLSGKGMTYRGHAYASKEKDIPLISSPSFSIFGESTQNSFFSKMTKDIIQDGFLPRFTFIEYDGERKKNRTNLDRIVPDKLIENIISLYTQSDILESGRNVIDIRLDNESQKMLDEFDDYCDNIINKNDDIISELANRAHLKALKLAGLIAVGNNIYDPLVTKEMAEYAIMVEKNSLESVSRQFRDCENIELTHSELKNKQIDLLAKKVLSIFEREKEGELKKYGIITKDKFRSLLKNKVFMDYHFGAVSAIEHGLTELLKIGALKKVDKRLIVKLAALNVRVSENDYQIDNMNMLRGLML